MPLAHFEYMLDIMYDHAERTTQNIIEALSFTLHHTYATHQFRNALRDRGYTVKSIVRIRLERNEAARAEWRFLIRPLAEGGYFDVTHLVFGDETHLSEEDYYQRRRAFLCGDVFSTSSPISRAPQLLHWDCGTLLPTES